MFVSSRYLVGVGGGQGIEREEREMRAEAGQRTERYSNDLQSGYSNDLQSGYSSVLDSLCRALCTQVSYCGMCSLVIESVLFLYKLRT